MPASTTQRSQAASSLARSVWSYLFAFVAIGLATALTELSRPHIAQAPLAFFYLAVLVVAIYGSPRAGGVAVVLAVCSIALFALRAEHGDLAFSLGLFAAVALAIVVLVASVRENQRRLSALVASATDAIIVLDAGRRIVLFNAAAEVLLKCPAASALGQPISRFLPQPADEAQPAIDGDGEPHEVSGCLADGTPLPLEASISQVLSGEQRLTTLILRDMRARKAHEDELERMNRLYLALSQVNQTIVLVRVREELLRKVCQVLVQHGGLEMAWIGWHDAATQRLVPIAEWGDEDGFARSIAVYADDRPEGRGPSGVAFRERRPFICNDALHDPSTLPWRTIIEKRGLHAAAAFPIRERGEVCGVLSVYARDAGFFRDKEVALLDEAASDISFALDNLLHEAERKRAEAEVQREREFSDAILESLPGILYLYDEQGRFLRWNAAFLKESGCTRDELLTMHPTQFFAGDDVARVAERIREVFEQGHATVEAVFVPKSGAGRQYFFTGRRLTFDGKPCLVGVGIDISDRMRAEQRLTQSESQYRELVQLANSIIVRWSPRGEIRFMNEFGLRFFGYAADEVIGKPVMGTIVPPSESGGRDLQQLMQRVRADPASFEHNVNENMRRGGERVTVAWTNRVVLDDDGQLREILSVGTDVTARVRAEEALRASEERQRTTLANILEGCQLLDFDWRYLYLNPAAEVHNRRANAELLGHTMTEMWPGIDTTPVFALFERTMRERVESQGEIDFTFPDGHHGWFEVRSEPVPEGMLVLSIDITERKRAEQAWREATELLEHKVAERTEELRGALLRAESADRVKSAFLATMSHELRTPLNSILGFTGLLLKRLAGPLTTEQEKQLDMVRTSAQHLLALINDVLDISKIEAGRMQVHAEPFALREAIERVAALLKPAAEQKGLQLRVELPARVPTLVSDRRRVEQIMLNLVNNAIKFTDEGSVSLSLEVDEATALPRHVHIRVTDTGSGIDATDLQTLFQPFRQLDSAVARSREGTGLGLAICRRLADLLGGSVHAASTLGTGSTFTLELPLRVPHEP